MTPDEETTAFVLSTIDSQSQRIAKTLRLSGVASDKVRGYAVIWLARGGLAALRRADRASIVSYISRMLQREALRERAAPDEQLADRGRDPDNLDLPQSSLRASSRHGEGSCNGSRGRVLQAALALLTPRQRQVVLQHAMNGLSFAETAHKLGVTRNAARLAYRRAISALRAARHKTPEHPPKHDPSPPLHDDSNSNP